MGVMRFLIHPAEMLDGWPEVYRAYISGPDGRVYPTRVEIDGNVMACRRHTSDSGRLHVAWPVPGLGHPVLCTSSLAEREAPYVLAVELARGKIAQVRDQLSGWELQGMQVPEGFPELHREAHRLFARATSLQDNPTQASRIAGEALAKECAAAELLAGAYTRQRLAVRRKRTAHLPASLGCNLGTAVPEAAWGELFREAFTTAIVPIEWRTVEPVEGEYHWDVNDAQVEWCWSNRLLAYGGPLLDLSSGGLPQWLWQWERDYLNMQSFVCDFVETAVTRYLGRIRSWEVSARANTGGALALSEEQRLSLVARTLEAARHVDEENQLMIRIDQPWGDYQARGQHRLSPLQFVDALIRAGIGLSGVNLEIAVGYRPRGSAPRDLLEFSRLIDLWSSLGIPLYVTLAFPSTIGPDPQAQSDLEVDEPGRWKTPWSESSQAEWVDLYLPLLMAKQAVVGICWTHFSDQTPHEFPHAGLIGPDGASKAALEHITNYRRAYWQADGEENVE